MTSYETPYSPREDGPYSKIIKALLAKSAHYRLQSQQKLPFDGLHPGFQEKLAIQCADRLLFLDQLIASLAMEAIEMFELDVQPTGLPEKCNAFLSGKVAISGTLPSLRSPGAGTSSAAVSLDEAGP